jgi:WD40 repeat protein
MAFGSESGLVATGHLDGVVRLWDTRCADSVASAGATATIDAACGWISGVAFCESAPHILASSSHDGVCRLYDDRSTKPL